MKLMIVMVASAACTVMAGCRTAPSGDGHVSQVRETDDLRRAEERTFSQMKDILVHEGRMPADYAMPERVMGSFGWHRNSDGSQVGMYAFNPASYEQAKRSWLINGVMETGSNILHAVNINAKFTDEVVGHHVDYIAFVFANVRYPQLAITQFQSVNNSRRSDIWNYHISHNNLRSMSQDVGPASEPHRHRADYEQTQSQKRYRDGRPSSPPIGRRVVAAWLLFSVGLWFLYGDRWSIRDDYAGIWIGASFCAAGLSLVCLIGYRWSWGWWL